MKTRNIFFSFLILFMGNNLSGLCDIYGSNIDPVTYFVSNSGADSNAGTSVSAAFKTIAAANAVVQPGDTVYLRSGDYNDPIKPARSGQPGKYITYKAYGEERPTLTATKDSKIPISLGYGIDYICVDGIYADGRGEHYSAYNSTINSWLVIGGSYNIIQNCNFRSAFGWLGVEILETGTYNKILRNRMDLIGTVNITLTENNESKADMVSIAGDYNLIEGNHFSRGGHNIIGTTTKADYNVIRNNLIENDWGDGNRYRAFVPKGINLWEGNIITKCGYVEGQRTTMNVGTFQFDSPNGIVRRNIFMNNYAKGMNGGCSDRLMVFHNVFYNTASSIVSVGRYSNSCVTKNTFKNNIIYNDGNKPIDTKFIGDPFIKFQGLAILAENRFIANSFYEEGKAIMVESPNDYGSKSLVEMQVLAPNNFSDNLIDKPLFAGANPNTYEDFQLLFQSPQIDKGDFLTLTVGAGNGKTMKVEEAMYFCDGFGLIGGDRIQLEGQSMAATVLNVNYTTNTITLDSDLNWSNGQGVSFEYKGSRPDIGVHETSLVSAPVFNPAAGTYTGVQLVAISSSTSGAVIRYTTDESDPTESSGILYTAPLNISEPTTLKAIAYKSGVGSSTVTTSVYTMQVSAPDFSPPPGIYASTQVVAISSTTNGAIILYTTDGTDPSETSGTVYTAPVEISETTTLKAIAYKTGMISSTITSGQYSISTIATVVLTPEADAYVHNGSPDQNFGTTNILQIRHAGTDWRREGFFRFDLSGVSGTVSSAVLSLYVVYGSPDVTHRIAYVSDDTWSETGITWNNMPAADLTNYLDMKSVGTTNVYVDYIITDKVQQELGGKISLKVYAMQNIPPRVDYASREHSTVAYRPKLTIVYSPELTSSQSIIAEPEGKSGNPLDNILIYPNPTKDLINLHGINAENTYAQLLDINGKVVKQVSNSNSIDIKDISGGFYFVRIKTAKQIRIYKIIVEK